MLPHFGRELLVCLRIDFRKKYRFFVIGEPECPKHISLILTHLHEAHALVFISLAVQRQPYKQQNKNIVYSNDCVICKVFVSLAMLF